MNPPSLWSLEIGDRGVLAPGRWFWPRVTLWLIGLFGLEALALFAPFQLRDWLGLPKGSRYYVGLLVPADSPGAHDGELDMALAGSRPNL